MLLLFGLIELFYLFQLTGYYYGWKKSHLVKPKTLLSNETFSVLIPFRNPNQNLQKILKELSNSGMRPIEIILIDDFSDEPFVYHFDKIQILRVHEEYPTLSSNTNNKKQAITYGVKMAKGSYIICLDADVTLPPNWLSHTIDTIETSRPKFIAGIHRYLSNDTFLSIFLALEQEVLTSISAASLYWGFPTMCNGANMAFEKKAFYDVNGYEGTFSILGGDDLLLMHRIYKRFPHDVIYNLETDCAVLSAAPENLSQLQKQRSRWLSKTFSYENKMVLPQMALVFLSNFIAVCSIGVALFYPTFILIFMAKVFIDTCYNVLTSPPNGHLKKWKTIFFASLIYPFYSIWIVASSINRKT